MSYQSDVRIQNRLPSPAFASSSDVPSPENKVFYPALDGLRAIAVIMVFYAHYLDYRPALRWGWTAVSLFFVLSGFLITGILYDTRNAKNRLRVFYMRRTLRIFPLFYGIFVVVVLLTPVFHWLWDPTYILWPLYLGVYGHYLWFMGILPHDTTLELVRTATPFTLYIGHFWSLAVEEQFYLVWPLVVFLVKDRLALRNLCAAACVLALTARIICLFVAPTAYLDADLLYNVMPLRADSLLLGGLIALMLRGPEAEWLKSIVRPSFYIFVSGFILFEIIYRMLTHHMYAPALRESYMSTIGQTLINLFSGLLILFALQPATRLYRFLTLKPLQDLGQMSYGFYVFHDIPHVAYAMLVLHVFGPIRYGGYVVAVIGFAGTLVLSYLSFRFFERPILRLKSHFTVAPQKTQARDLHRATSRSSSDDRLRAYDC